MHMHLPPLWLLVYTEYNNAMMKDFFLGGGGIILKLQLSPGQLQVCFIKLCMIGWEFVYV